MSAVAIDADNSDGMLHYIFLWVFRFPSPLENDSKTEIILESER